MPKIPIQRRILAILKEHECTPKELQNLLGVSGVTVHKYLNILLAGGNIRKIGTRPDVHYQFVRDQEPVIRSKVIRDTFIYIKPEGGVCTGAEAFIEWSKYNLKKLSLEEKIERYEQCIRNLRSQKENGVYTLREKWERFRKETGEDVYIQEVVSAAPYALPDFGKTMEATLLEIAKSEKRVSAEFANQLVDMFLPPLLTYLEYRKPQAVAFVPPTARRKVQIMKVLKKRFGDFSELPVVTVKKKHTDIDRQQKHLSGIHERIRNAEDTMFPDLSDRPSEPYDSMLLIDDMVGSGATLNQIAKKCIAGKIAKTIYGIGIIGDRKGFKVEKVV